MATARIVFVILQSEIRNLIVCPVRAEGEGVRVPPVQYCPLAVPYLLSSSLPHQVCLSRQQQAAGALRVRRVGTLQYIVEMCRFSVQL